MEAAMPTPHVSRATQARCCSFRRVLRINRPSLMGLQPGCNSHGGNGGLRPGAASGFTGVPVDRGRPSGPRKIVVPACTGRLLFLSCARLPDPRDTSGGKARHPGLGPDGPGARRPAVSFASCLRVVGTSPLSPTPYFGAVQVEDVREWLRTNARKWLRATLARYPDWVQALVRASSPTGSAARARQRTRSGSTSRSRPVRRRSRTTCSPLATPACRARFRHEPGPHQSGLGACRHLPPAGPWRARWISRWTTASPPRDRPSARWHLPNPCTCGATSQPDGPGAPQPDSDAASPSSAWCPL